MRPRPRARVLALALAPALLLIAAVAGVPDTTVIIRLNSSYEYSSADEAVAEYEVHTRTNSMGKLLLEGNRSTEPASFYTLSALEGGEGTWSPVVASLKQEIVLSIPGRSPCNYNDGGCEIQCTTSSRGYSECSCPVGFILNDDRRTCLPAPNTCTYILHENGTFKNPGYPGYENNMDCFWLLVTSRGKRIRLEVPELVTETNYDFVYAYDGSKVKNVLLSRWSGSGRSLYVVSRSNVMTVLFHTDASNLGRGFVAKFSSEEANLEPSTTVLQLNSPFGKLASTVSGLDNEFCAYVVHKSSPEDLNVKFQKEPGRELEMRSSVLHRAVPWHISRFTLPEEVGATVNTAKLIVELKGQGNAIAAVTPCSSPEEDAYFLGRARWADYTRDFDKEVPPGNCYNGGVRPTEERGQECVCSPGFTGADCQEGCGPNTYGNDCKATCSDFQDGCKNMIFCKDDLPCSCGAGFTGQLCSELCVNGTYGSGCKNQCGRCLTGPCDIYTGKCSSGCEPGYYPPLCQKEYLRLSNAPVLVNVNYTDAVISVNLSSSHGAGSVYFFQTQYKEEAQSTWVQTQPTRAEQLGTVLYKIRGLKVGTKYLARVILISEDGNSYEFPDVPTLQFSTLCRIPDSKNYVISVNNVTASSFIISWQYNISDPKWCPIVNYRMTLGTRWQKFQRTLLYPNTQYSNLLAAHRYEITICAITTKGTAACSSKFFVTTTDDAPGEVRNLKAFVSGTKLGLSWEVPLHTGGTIKAYRIKYQCIKLLGCSLPCAHDEGEVETRVLSAELGTLQPHAQYLVKVAGVAANQGPYTPLFATTPYTSPSTAPAASERPVFKRTNTTASVQWNPPANCSGLNGFLLHYRYDLVDLGQGGSASERRVTVFNETTEGTEATFAGLSPMTQYEANVYVVTSGGWNSHFKLTIPFTTSATAPEPVLRLEVYKRGRRALGLRWAAPDRSYGPIRSFTVAHRPAGSAEAAAVAEVLDPQHCEAWPSLYCHTIERLAPDVNYILKVSARNVEVDEDGAVAEVTSVTHEGAPGPPEGLRVSNRTSSSLQLQWAPPRLFNGLLRSFLVNVEQVDAAGSAECCEYFPVQELPVRAESALYSLEVSGLPPAALYTVSVSAKTVTLGPAVNATSNTAPDAPDHLLPPTVVRLEAGGRYIVLINSDQTYPLFESTYLLLMLPIDGPRAEASVWDEELSEKLHAAVGQEFYVVTELKEAELAGGRRLRLGAGGPERRGQLAALSDPPLAAGAEYRPALALVLRYRGAASVAVAFGEPFSTAQGPEPS